MKFQHPIQVDELQQEKERIIRRIDELKLISQEEYQEEILKYIDWDNPKIYRKKMKGFMLPFNSRSKYEDTNQYKFKIPKDIEEIRKQVRLIKSQREKQRMQNDVKKRFEYDRHQNIMRKMHEGIMRDKGLYIIPASNVGSSLSLLPGGLINSAATNRRPQGYKLPK